MFTNYLKIAWRNLLRHRHFTLLNILGLSVGVAAALLLFMAVRYEFSFDTFHPDGDRIYRIARKQVYSNGNEDYTVGYPLPVAAALKTDIPQFETVVPIFATLRPQVTVLGRTPAIRNNAAKFLEEREGFLAGPEFFQLFNFPWRIGTPASLARPNVVALTESYARKYFGSSKQAMGQYLRINNRFTMEVVGVLADLPKNTSFPLNLVISYETKRHDFTGAFGMTSFDDWGSSSSNDQLFVRLSRDVSMAQADALLATFSRRHYDRLNSSDKKTHFLNPLAELHHDARFDGFAPNTVPVPRQRLWNMVAVGALILLMACINFINISSALATKRAKEVGVRKVLGSHKSQLVTQFLVETVLMVVAAIGIGVALAYTALPLLGSLFGLPTDSNLYFGPELALGLLALLVVLTALAGLYPALVLSSFSPLVAFRNRVVSGWGRGLSLRQGLIVVQFTAALVLLIGTVINLQQMNFLSRMDLGFAKDGIFYFKMDREYGNRNPILRNELLRIPGVSNVTFFSDLPSSDVRFQSSFAFSDMAKDEDFPVSIKMVDGDYIKTYGIQLVAGTSYPTNDTITKFLVNETLLKKLNVRNPASVIGRRLRVGQERSAEIVGVVKDFQTNSARDGGVQPLVLLPDRNFFYGGSVKLRSPNLVRTVEQIKATYARTFPEVAFWGKFYNDELNTYYITEQQMGLLYRVFAGLILFIACLGLFGLAAFSAEARTKEIGVRKVLGASVSSIVTLLSKDFLKLVFIAIVIASPIAWYITNRWLQDFAYRIAISWWVFALAGLLAVGIALLTVGLQSIRAALVNPVKSLRSE
ncbi:ABC transporter permease [Spirosoma pomorum]